MLIFGERLKELRIKAHLSQQELSEIVGASKSSINMYERGEREPGLEMIARIANYFGVQTDYLLGTNEKQMKKERKNEMKKGLTDEEVEIEIKRLENSPLVKLARKEERVRYARRQRLYGLRMYEKKGKELAAAGITMEMLESLEKEE